MQSPHKTLGPSRRTLLIGAGATVAASALDRQRTSCCRWQRRTLAPIPSPDTLPLTGGPEFPVGLFWPPHPYASTPQRFAEIAEAGFDFVISGNYAGDGNIFQYQLDLARTAGLQMLISDDIQIRNMSRWFSISDNPADFLSITPAEAREFYTRARDAYGPYSSLAGFNFYDEPGAGWFGTLAKALAVSRELAPQLAALRQPLPVRRPGVLPRLRRRGEAVARLVRPVSAAVRGPRGRELLPQLGDRARRRAAWRRPAVGVHPDPRLQRASRTDRGRAALAGQHQPRVRREGHPVLHLLDSRGRPRRGLRSGADHRRRQADPPVRRGQEDQHHLAPPGRPRTQAAWCPSPSSMPTRPRCRTALSGSPRQS